MDEIEPLRIVVPDPSLVVLVGAAGSGKSTFAARHFAPAEVLSSDAFRALVAGDPSDQRATVPAFAALHRALVARAAAGRLSVVDATNVRPHARRALLTRAARAGLAAVAIVLDLPAPLVVARNAARAGTAAIPEDAVHAQLAELARSFTPSVAPAWAGFDRVYVLRTPADVDRAVVVRDPSGRGASVTGD